MSLIAAFSDPLNYFTFLHDYPVMVALAIIGAVTLLVMVICVVLRGAGDIYEEYCNFRRRCTAARRRLNEETNSS